MLGLGDILSDPLEPIGDDGADKLRADPLGGAVSSFPLEAASSELFEPLLRVSGSGEIETETMPLRRDWLTRFRTDAGSEFPLLERYPSSLSIFWYRHVSRCFDSSVEQTASSAS